MSERQHHYLRWLFILVIVAVAAVVLWWSQRPDYHPVVVKAVERGPVERSVANTRAGTVKACRRAKLSPSVGGQIASLPIREGDRVETGQLLLELWNKDFAAELDLAESEVLSARSQAQSACFNADESEREAARLVRLRKEGAVSVEAADQAVTKARMNRADCAAARASIDVSAARIGVAMANIERTRLIAPFDGVIAKINGELNEYVTPSPPGIPTPPAVDLIDDGCYYVSAPIDEVDAGLVRLGLVARIGLDAFANRHFDGKVRRIAPYVLDVEKQARTVDVEVEFVSRDDDRVLLAGYSADVEIIVESAANTLRIPTEAIINGDSVLILNRDNNLLETRLITIGLSNWNYTEVKSGLETGQWVVTSIDREGVKDGAYAVVEQGLQ